MQTFVFSDNLPLGHHSTMAIHFHESDDSSMISTHGTEIGVSARNGI
jgi:hypothetical protein